MKKVEKPKWGERILISDWVRQKTAWLQEARPSVKVAAQTCAAELGIPVGHAAFRAICQFLKVTWQPRTSGLRADGSARREDRAKRVAVRDAQVFALRKALKDLCDQLGAPYPAVIAEDWPKLENYASPAQFPDKLPESVQAALAEQPAAPVAAKHDANGRQVIANPRTIPAVR